MNDDAIAYQLGELAEMQAVRKRGPMIDQARLREALNAWPPGPNMPRELVCIIEVARLVASETTLIVEKVNGEWPHGAIGAIHNWWVNDKGNHPATELLDALLVQQTGDTK